MEHQQQLSAAAEYHQALPPRIRAYLNQRGIPDSLIDAHQIGWNGSRITIPVFDRQGELAFFKLAKDPADERPGPKILAAPGSRLELYGWEEVLKSPDEIVICEGEFDRLVLKAQGFRAVTSTAGARAFRAEWAQDFEAIPHVFVCFDRDDAGQAGAERVARLIPHARIVELPEDVGEGGDVTDFFIRLGRTDDDFRQLLSQAVSAPPEAVPASEKVEEFARRGSPLRQRIDRLKQAVPISTVIARYVELGGRGDNLMGLCPSVDFQPRPGRAFAGLRQRSRPPLRPPRHRSSAHADSKRLRSRRRPHPTASKLPEWVGMTRSAFTRSCWNQNWNQLAPAVKVAAQAV